jgi:hypothetical protein
MMTLRASPLVKLSGLLGHFCSFVSKPGDKRLMHSATSQERDGGKALCAPVPGVDTVCRISESPVGGSETSCL